MKPLLNLFVSICLLRKGPQDVPFSYLLFTVAIFCYCVIDISSYMIIMTEKRALTFSSVIPFRITRILLNMVVIVLLMWLLRYQSRILQTLTAIAGCGAVITVLLLPFSYFSSGTLLGVYAFAVAVAIMLWSLLVYAHIFRQALSTSSLNASMLSIALFFLNFLFILKLSERFMVQ